jgi:hypothetical protein
MCVLPLIAGEWFEGAFPDHTHTVTPTGVGRDAYPDMLMPTCTHVGVALSLLHTKTKTDPERSSTPVEYQQLGLGSSTTFFSAKASSFFHFDNLSEPQLTSFDLFKSSRT